LDHLAVFDIVMPNMYFTGRAWQDKMLIPPLLVAMPLDDGFTSWTNEQLGKSRTLIKIIGKY